MRCEQVCSKMVPKATAVVENDGVIALCSGTDGELNGMHVCMYANVVYTQMQTSMHVRIYE